jgi:shikimate dehydrogenase
VYTRGETDLLAQARARGATVIGGLEILVRQAAAAFELWTGRSAPLDVMRDATRQR